MDKAIKWRQAELTIKRNYGEIKEIAKFNQPWKVSPLSDFHAQKRFSFLTYLLINLMGLIKSATI